MGLFKKAETANNVVVLVRGQPGTYKTRFSLGFKRVTGKPVAYIGTDRGARLYADDPEVGGFHAIESRDIKVIRQAVKELAAGAYRDYGAIVVDTTTDIYEAILAEKMVTGPKGRFVPLSAYKPAKEEHEELLRSLQGLPLHVCFVMEEKSLFEKIGQGQAVELKEVGTTEDGNKKDSYVCDVRLRFFVKDGKFHGEVLKDRTGTFPMGKIVENPKPEMWVKGAVEVPPASLTVMETPATEEEDEPRLKAQLVASALVERIKKVSNKFEWENWKKKHKGDVKMLEQWPDIYEQVVEVGKAKTEELDQEDAA